MRKLFAILMMVLALLSLCACATGNHKAPAIAEIIMPQPTEISINEKVTVGELSFKITKQYYANEYNAKGTTYVPGTENTFFCIDLTMYNDSRKEIRQGSFPSIWLDYDNGYDGHGMDLSTIYQQGTYFDVILDPLSQDDYLYVTKMPKVQAEDKESPIVLEITFQGEKFMLKIQ